MNKFIENGIAKQEQAYKKSFAKKNFEYSCTMCASRNLLHCSCESCPIAGAYSKAIEEIDKGLRKRNTSTVKTHIDKKGHITLTLNLSKDVSADISIFISQFFLYLLFYFKHCQGPSITDSLLLVVLIECLKHSNLFLWRYTTMKGMIKKEFQYGINVEYYNFTKQSPAIHKDRKTCKAVNFIGLPTMCELAHIMHYDVNHPFCSMHVIDYSTSERYGRNVTAEIFKKGRPSVFWDANGRFNIVIDKDHNIIKEVGNVDDAGKLARYIYHTFLK